MADLLKEKIIKIEPVEDIFILDWQTDIRCNFDCSYCASNYHDLTSPYTSLDQLKTNWQKLFEKVKTKNKKIKLGLLGGESTSNPNFLPFLVWLRENYSEFLHSISIVTNGSASQRYFLELIKLVDTISFSTHSEFFNEKKFFSNILFCIKHSKNKVGITVHIMDEPWHRERIKDYINFCTKYKINYSVDDIYGNYTLKPVKLNPNKFDFTNVRIQT